MDRLVTIRVSLRSLIAVLALLAVVAVLLRIPELLVEVFVAIVVASAMLPSVRALERRPRWSRIRAVAAIFALVGCVLLLLAEIGLPRFIDQASGIATTLPKMAALWSAWYEGLRGHGGVWRYLPSATTLPTRLGTDAAVVLGQGLDWTKRAVQAVSAIAIVVVLAFFILLDGPELRSGLLQLVPPRYRPVVDAQIDPVAFKLGRYVQGTLTSIAFFILFQGIALSIVGLPMALGVAVLSGILEVIPILGTLVGLLLGLGIAATVSSRLVVEVLAVGIVGRLLQDNLVNPYVFSQSLKLPPTLVIVSLLLGAQLMGIAGALVAVPVLAAVQVLVQNLYVARRESQITEEPVVPATEVAPIRLHVTFMHDAWEPTGDAQLVLPPDDAAERPR